jgi:inner membrane protein
MPWWMWMLLALVLLGLEVQTFSSFYLMFFGLGAALVGLLVALGAVETDWVEWLLFTVLSVASLVAFRGPILARMSRDTVAEVDSLIGETAVAIEAIAPDGVGKVELRGAPWSARNAGATPLAPAQRCRVDRVQGLTLWVRAES